MIDILIIAIIAVAIIYKFYSILGKDIDNTISYQKVILKDEIDDVSVKNKKNREKEIFDTEFFKQKIGQEASKILGEYIFSPFDFLKGAKTVFEMIYEAYPKGDFKIFSTLMTPSIIERFNKIFQSYKELNEILNINLIGIDSAEIKNIKVEDDLIKITVQFNSRQIFWITDQNGLIIDGNKETISNVEDIWVFEKKIKSQSKIWLLSQVLE